MANKMFDLTGKHAVVTGANSPLGRSLAVALAEAGATVSVTTLRKTQQEEVEANSILNECWSAGSQKGKAVAVDLTDEAGVEAAFAGLESSVGPIDIVVNAGHAANIKPLLESSLADWNNEISRNATTVFVSTLAAGKRMVPRKKGRIINIVSDIHDRGVPNCAIFGASQGAVLGFTKNLAIEWGVGEPLVEDRLTVNAIQLGFMEDVPGPHQDPVLGEIMQKYIPLRRLGSSKDLQGAVVYLASDRSNYINAETITVDGSIVNHA